MRQAWNIAGSKEDRKVAAFLLVKAVCAIRPVPDPDATIPSPNVVWDRQEVDEYAPGNIGHAGITGLDSTMRKTYRKRLADLSIVQFL